jgi:U3 small nucleolar RNA-associated protein MPP10
MLTSDPDEQDSDQGEEQPDKITYEEFYLPPVNSKTSRKRKRISFEDTNSVSGDELDNEARLNRFHKDLFADAAIPPDPSQPKVSKYAQRQATIKAEVAQLEQENISDKQWMYIGEATARDRPKNSLLELSEEIEVERSAKPVPVVTEERTRSLEDIIKQRIIDNLYDDVKRKIPPSVALKSRSVDDDPDMQEPGSKSSRGLAEVYEQEHLRRIDPANNPTPLALSVQKQHEEIDELWKNLSHQLDSLTSWRFIPAPEIVNERVVANIPAVEMEDARPEAESGVAMLAPQEVYRPEAKKGEIVVGGVPVARVEMSREEKVKARKREGKKREKKKQGPVEGSKKDVVDTLKKGGVKIIPQGRGRGRGGHQTGK